MAERDQRFAAVVGVKDESDILPHTLDRLRSLGFGYIIVVDHGSTDGTLDYLAEAETRGDIWVHRREGRAPPEVGRLATMAIARASEADWILFIDADEIVLTRSGSVLDLGDTRKADVLSVMRYNVVVTDSGPSLPGSPLPGSWDEVLLYAQPVPDFYRHSLLHPETPWISGVLEPKVMLRPEALVDIQAGGHGADLTMDRAWRRAVATDIVIAHVPLRSADRFRIRAANYSAAVARRPAWFTGGQGWQWLRFAQAFDEGRIDEEYRSQVLGRDELARLRDSLVVRSARDLFGTPIPEVTSEELHRSMVRRAEPWLWATGLVCRAEGIDPEGKLELLDGRARTPVVFIPPGSVVKFHAHWADGYAVAAREAENLRRLAGWTMSSVEQSQLAVPRLLAEGSLQAYRYNVMTRVPGTPLRQLEALEGPADRDELPAAIGAFLRWLHGLPLTGSERENGWSSFVKEVERRRSGALVLNRERGLPEHLLAELEGWLPATDELVGDPSSAVLRHGALDDRDLLGWLDGRRFVPTGVIGFARASVGHPLSELAPIWWLTLSQDAAEMNALLRSWQPPGWDGPGFARRALAWMLIGGTAEATFSSRDEARDLDGLAQRWVLPAPTAAPA